MTDVYWPEEALTSSCLVEPQLFCKSAGFSATGIPDRRNFGDLQKLQAGQLVTLVRQLHDARRAGCFAAETPVLMADGTYRPIASICPGELVHTPLGPRPVIRQWRHPAVSEWLRLSCANFGITVTPNHPFYVKTVGWVQLQYLEGMTLHAQEIDCHARREDLCFLREAVLDDQQSRHLRKSLPNQATTTDKKNGEAGGCSSDFANLCNLRDDLSGFLPRYTHENMRSQLRGKAELADKTAPEISEINTGRAASTSSASYGAVSCTQMAGMPRAGRQKLADRALSAAGIIASRSSIACENHQDANLLGAKATQNSYTEEEARTPTRQNAWRQQSALERRHLQRKTHGLVRKRLPANAATKDTDCCQGLDLRMVRRSTKKDRSAPHHSVSLQSIKRGQQCIIALHEMPCAGGWPLSGSRRKAIQIERLPGVDRCRYDLEVAEAHCYFVGPFLAHNSHFDVRLGTPQSGLFSWATRKEFPQPGGRIAVFQQPVHAYGYKDFQGTLQGYGAGQVRKHHEGRVMVTKISPDAIHFTTAWGRHPERFVMTRTQDKNWLLINTTPTKQLPYKKIHYKKVPQEAVETVLGKLAPGSSVQAKIDGASSLVSLLRDGSLELSSYRGQKETDYPILHTERVLASRPKLDMPRHLAGSVLRGEIYGERDHHAIPVQELGGLLNSSIEKSLHDQQARNVRLRNALFDIQQYGQQPIDFNVVPYAERRQMLREILPYLPQAQFSLTPEATTPDEAMRLWQQIHGARHPLTSEGIVIHAPYGRPRKAKLLEESDVHVTGTFPGEGRRASTIGGLTYGLEPGGPTVGRVGTGFSDELLGQIAAAPEDYVGTFAKIRHQGQLPSGAYRAPVFLSQHLDYPLAKGGNEHVDIRGANQIADRLGSDLGLEQKRVAKKIETKLVSAENRYDARATENNTQLQREMPITGGMGSRDRNTSVCSFPAISCGLEQSADSYDAFARNESRASTISARIQDLEQHEVPLLEQKSSEIQVLWRQGDHDLSEMVASLSQFCGRYGHLSAGAFARSHRRQSGLCAGQLPLGVAERTNQKCSQQCSANIPGKDTLRNGVGRDNWNFQQDNPKSAAGWLAAIADFAASRRERQKSAQQGLTAAKKFAADASLLADIAKAEAATNTSPSQAQRDAGNYAKGKVRLHGLTVAIENPAGSYRSGVSVSGKAWRTKLRHAYGYILGTEGRDGDHVDVFLGPHPEAELVFAVNQIDPENKKFDEHKILLGFLTEAEAREAYLANYETGWQGLGSLAALTMPEFKRWLSEGDTTKVIKTAAATTFWSQIRDAIPQTQFHYDSSQGLWQNLSRYTGRLLGTIEDNRVHAYAPENYRVGLDPQYAVSRFRQLLRGERAIPPPTPLDLIRRGQELFEWPKEHSIKIASLPLLNLSWPQRLSVLSNTSTPVVLTKMSIAGSSKSLPGSSVPVLVSERSPTCS